MVAISQNFVVSQINNNGGVLHNVAIGIGNVVVSGARQPSESWSFDGTNRSVNAETMAYGSITTGAANNIVGFSRSGETGANALTLSPTPSGISPSPTSPAPSTPVQGNAGWVAAVAQGAGKAFSYMAKGTLENAGKAAGAFAQGFQQSFGQQGSMGQTPVAAYPVRPQPAAANQQQGGFSQRQTTASVNQPETLSQRFGNVFKNTAGYGLVAVAASGGALLAPVAVAAVAVIAAYKAIQALEAVMNFFKGANKGQQTTQQQQQQQQARQQQQQTQGQTGQQAQPPVAQSTTAPTPAQEQQSPAASQGQQPSPGLETSGNANGASTGIQFTQDVNLGGVDAPSAPNFNLDAVMGALSARGSR